MLDAAGDMGREKRIDTTGEPFTWYQDKREWIAAGQPRKSKIYKRLHLHPQVGVLDLVAVTYPAWQARRFFLPEARLWTFKPVSSPVSKRRIAR